MTWIEILWWMFWRSLERRQHERPYRRVARLRACLQTARLGHTPEGLGPSSGVRLSEPLTGLALRTLRNSAE